MKRVSIFLITVALIAGMTGCNGYTRPAQNLEIRDWYDLDAVRDNTKGHHTLMNDLNSTTPGYEELAGPTANGGKGWQPIIEIIYPWGDYESFTGTFDGQGYKIRDLFINRPGEDDVGLFSYSDGIIKEIRVVNVTVTGDRDVGGLVGVNCGTMSNCYSTGSVTGNNRVGGLVGLNECGNLSSSYSTGSVTGTAGVGGLVGMNFDLGTVRNSYSTGSVTGEEHVGGLVGWNEGIMSNSYSTGNVTGGDHVGGLVGGNAGAVNNSFWDIETSGQSTSDGGTGNNTTEMQDIATYLDGGWSIITVALNQTNPAYIWNIVNNVTYPFLNWQP